MPSNNSLSQGFRDVRKLTSIAKVPLWVWSFPALLSLGASTLEGLGIGLIAPLIEVLAHKGDISSLKSVSLLNDFLPWLPELRFRYVFFFLLGAICVSVALKSVLVFFSEFFVSKVSRLIEHRLRVAVYQKYLSFGKQFFDQSKIGNLADLATTQVLVAAEVFRFINYLMSNMFVSIIYVLLMLFISWKLMLSAMLFLPCIYGMLAVLSKKVRASSEAKFQIDQQINSYLIDALSNVMLIKSAANEEREIDRFRGLSNLSRQTFNSIWKKVLFAPRIQEVLLTCAIALLVAFCVLAFMTGGGFGLGAFITFFIVLRRFAQAAGQTGVNLTEITRMFAPTRQIAMAFDDTDKPFVKCGNTPYAGLTREIRFKDVEFGYRPGDIILKKLNVAFTKGRTTAVVGVTGAGKSTIIHLLMRFYDATAGTITIDGTDIHEFQTGSLLSKFALVDQNTSVFNATLRDNIVYGIKNPVTEAELDLACKKASLYDFIQKLPEKYETSIGDRGVRLSGGERQRLAIARAILKDPDLFIFDEATSSLDVETEQSIQIAIQTAAKNKTMIVVAHRLSTIKNADWIVVLENGTASEQGTFAELSSRNGSFQRYWNLLLKQPEQPQRSEGSS